MKRWAAMHGGMLVLVAGMAGGCTDAGKAADAADAPTPSVSAMADAPRIAGTQSTVEVVALVGGKPVEFRDLRGLLVESSGGIVLNEIILDRLLAEKLKEQRIAVTEQDVENERKLLLQQMAPNDPDTAVRLLGDFRQRLNLGAARFDLFLHRYAALRKLIAGNVNVTDNLLRQAYEARYAQQTVCRLILVNSQADASQVLRRLSAGESFSDLAVELSTDTSRNQGGLLPPISAFDRSFPAAVVNAATRMVPGQVTDVPIALDGGFAILKCERKIDQPAPPFESVAQELAETVRYRMERIEMQRLARVLLEGADVTILDSAFHRAYEQQRRQIAEP